MPIVGRRRKAARLGLGRRTSRFRTRGAANERGAPPRPARRGRAGPRGARAPRLRGAPRGLRRLGGRDRGRGPRGPPRGGPPRPRDRRLAAAGRGGARPPAQRVGPGHAADGDHDEPRQRARGRRGHPRGRGGLPREERGGPGRPAPHRRAGRASPAGRGGARRPRRGHGGGGGEAFFGELVLRLARALRVKYASVAEIVDGGRLRTVARFVDGRLVANVEYPLAGTPCAGVLDGSVCHIRDGVADRYPGDEGLRRIGAQSYVGTRPARLDRRGPGHRQRHSRPAPRRGRAPRGRPAGLRRQGGGGDRAAAGRARDRAAAGVRRQPPRHGGLAGHRRGPLRPRRALQPGLRAGERVDGSGAGGPGLLGRAAPRRDPRRRPPATSRGATPRWSCPWPSSPSG